MKTFKQITVLLATIYFTVGCAKSASQAVMNNNNGVYGNGQTVVPPIYIDPYNPGSANPSFSGGSTVDFTPVNIQTMNEYVATHPLNNPSNFKINVNVAQVQAGRFGGAVSISYTDNNLNYNGVFKSGLGVNQTFKGMYDNGELESKYNYWFNHAGKTVFSGFFEDQYGAIVITLEPLTQNPPSGNDGEPILNQGYKGSVYFKNFTTTPAPHSPYRACWFTYYGPYDCRSEVVQTKCGIAPGAASGYKLLGTFTNLNVKAAFNTN